MPRKPLIEAGSLLPPAATGRDTMSRILERDRAKSGRRPPDEVKAPISSLADNETETATDITSNITENITAQARSSEYDHADVQLAANEAARPRRSAASRTSAQPIRARAVVSAATEQAKRLAATPAMPITLRLPTGLNDFLDDYAHEHRKEGVKKQDLVARAVQLLVIELAAPEAEGEGS